MTRAIEIFGSGEDRRRAILTLRWLVIIATSYLVLLSKHAPRNPMIAALLAEFIFSNVILHFVDAGWLSQPRVLTSIVVLDSLACSAALLLTPGIEQNVVVVYFFVILLSALGGSFQGSVFSAFITSALYLGLIVAQRGTSAIFEPGVLLQVPFLFCVGAFYGYLAAEARHARVRADTAEISTRAKSELIATLTHDVRNNLSAITGYAEVVLELLPGDVSPEVRTIVQRMQVIALEGVQLISNLLDADRLGNGRLAFQHRPVALGQLVARVAERYEAQAALKGVALQSRVPEGLPMIEGDELHLDRVFANLLSNAVKFTPSGGRVEVAASANGASVRVEVADTGPGIPQQERERVFQMYRQTEAGARHGGSGLGLYVVRSLVEAHGGDVAVTSKPSGGALFRVTLPLANGTPH